MTIDTGLIISEMINFLLVGIVFIVLMFIVFKIVLKKFNVKSNKIKFYGVFLGMNNRSILAFCTVTLNFIFLIWCTASFTGLNIVYIFITTVLMILSDLFIKNYSKIIVNLIYTACNVLCIFVTSMLYNYLMNEAKSILLLIVLGLVLVFVFLYYTYQTFKFLNNIVLKQENLTKKEYKKI